MDAVKRQVIRATIMGDGRAGEIRKRLRRQAQKMRITGSPACGWLTKILVKGAGMQMKDWKIGTRITAGFAAVITVTLAMERETDYLPFVACLYLS
jgi:hypothetical protein